MKKVNRTVRITATISILLDMLVGIGKSIKHEEIEQIFKDVSDNTHTYMPFCTIVSDGLKLEDYAEKEKSYVFIKNILPNDGEFFKSLNTTDIIVTEAKPNFKNNYLHTCFYTEIKKNGKIKKKYVSHLDTTTVKDKKKMLIISNNAQKQEILIARLEEAKNQLKNPEEAVRIKRSLEFIRRVLNQMTCQLYINRFINGRIYLGLSNCIIEYKKNQLQKAGISNTTAYALLNRKVNYNEREALAQAFKIFKSNEVQIEEIVDKNKTADLILGGNQKEIEKMFKEDTDRILKQIESREKLYNTKTVEDLKKDFDEDTMMFINILTNGRLNLHIYVNVEELEKEIEKEKRGKARDKLVEIVKKCTLSSGKKITIDKLWEEIKNEFSSGETNFYAEKQKRIKPSTSTKTEKPKNTEDVVAIKANKILNRIMSSGDVEIIIDVEGLKKETAPWNADLVQLLAERIIKYSKFHGSIKTIIKNLIKSNTNIISELITNRETEYNGCKNISMMQKMFETGLVVIMKILENQKNNPNLQKEIIAQENMQIIGILDNISKDHDVPEKHSALNMHKKDVKRVVSEIAEEFIKAEVYSVTDASIQEKKQSIIDIVFKKLATIKNKNALVMKKMIREIVEQIINVLVNRTIDRTQYKGFSAVKEEIKREKDYIRSQDSRDILMHMFEFIEKQKYILSYNSSIVTADGNYIRSERINLMKNVFNKEEDINEWMLCNIIDDKRQAVFDIAIALNNICMCIDTLKTYNEIWINPVCFVLDNWAGHLQKENNKACIFYFSCITHKNCIKLTNTNLKAFGNAKTLQDIKNIGIRKYEILIHFLNCCV